MPTGRRLLCSLLLLAFSSSAAFAQAQISVNGTLPPAPVSFQAGTVVTAAIGNGPGSATDWIGLYAVGTGDGAYLDWMYLSGSTAPPASPLTNATIQLLLPVAPGDYEIRFFANNGYQRLATSTTITVLPSPTTISINGAAPPNPVTVSAGTTLSVGVANGPGNATDWIALYPAAAPDGAGYTDWRYLNGTTVPPPSGQATASITLSAPVTAGTYQLRVFARDTYQRLATTTFTVQSPSAQLMVNGVTSPEVASAAAGSMATVALSGGPGNTSDWVGLFAQGAADNQYLDWKYLNGTITFEALVNTRLE